LLKKMEEVELGRETSILRAIGVEEGRKIKESGTASEIARDEEGGKEGVEKNKKSLFLNITKGRDRASPWGIITLGVYKVNRG